MSFHPDVKATLSMKFACIAYCPLSSISTYTFSLYVLKVLPLLLRLLFNHMGKHSRSVCGGKSESDSCNSRQCKCKLFSMCLSLFTPVIHVPMCLHGANSLVHST